MTPADCIRELAWRFATEEPSARVLDEADLARWPPVMVEAIRRSGLLREYSPASRCACPGCDDGHMEDVLWLTDVTGGQHPVVRCPVYGRVELGLSALQRWFLDVEGVVRLLRDGLATQGRLAVIRPGRAWSLGVARAGTAACEVVLVRGVLWHDGAELQHAVGEREALVVAAETQLPDWLRGAIRVTDLISWDGAQLAIDRVVVEARLSQMSPARAAGASLYLFRQDGDGWLLAFGDAPFRMRHLSGLRDIHTLLQRANQPVPIIDITDVGLVQAGIPPISPEALARLRALIDAGDAGDRQAEQFLRAVTKIGGGPRSGPSPLSKAASMVRNRIGRAVDALHAHNPAMAQHLDRSIQRGIVLSYRSDPVLDWET